MGVGDRDYVRSKGLRIRSYGCKAFCEVNSVFFSISELGSIIFLKVRSFISAAAQAHRLRR